jgi:2-keto-3-deoxy-L-rhamnonate aldolase RhmA
LLNSNWLLNKLRNTAEPCIGTWVTIPSPELVDVICSAEPDFIVIDSEHSPVSFETAQLMSMVCTSRNVSPVFRVPDVIQDQIVPALEIGSHAIQAPNISTIEDAKAFSYFSRYQPVGGKGLSPYTRACNYSGEFAGQMIDEANQNTLLIAQVEGREGIENIERILTVKEIDICFLGLYDLSNYLQIPGQLDNSKLIKLFMGLIDKIHDAGVIVGSIASSKEQLDFLIRAGVRYITYAADCEVISRSYRDIFGSAKHKKLESNNEFRY